jgi:hypothetical protein
MGRFQDLAGFSTGGGGRGRPFVRLFFLVFILLLALGGCDLFQVSLTEYLKKERNEPPDAEEPDTGPWVYVKAASGDDTAAGWSPDTAVKTLGKAVQIWLAEEDSPNARIKLLEDIGPGYNDPGVATSNERIDFSSLTPPGIDTLLLAGDGTTTITGGTGRRVLSINNPSKTITLKDLVVTGGSVIGAIGGGGIRVAAGNLTISGVVITGNTAGTGGGVYIGGNAVFTMMSGEIHNNTVSGASGKGGGVFSNQGQFIMKGGSVYDNTAPSGGGVFVGNSLSFFTMEGGDIYGNGAATTESGGGVFVANPGTFTMNGGTIRDNTAAKNGGGVFVGKVEDTGAAKFVMEGGLISGNKTTDGSAGKGGGVYVSEYGNFTMTGGTVSDNESGNDGGGVYVTGSVSATGSAKIQNGRIGGENIGDGNKAKYGGGVYVGASGTLELGVDGGEAAYPFIQNNTAEEETGSTGGGLVINGGGASATFFHGTVRGNKAAALGGGILVVDGALTMAGGTVTENSVNPGGNGPGLALEGGSFVMKDRARVLDPANPVYLHTSGLTIGLGSFTGPFAYPHIAYVITNGVDYGSGTAILAGTPSLLLDYFLYFNVDDEGFGLSLASDGKIP